uniref:uncharacterized protein LOC124075008 n=1 Tax=Scatophagus argus TaxID=75038 RepID=UPI001ED81AE7|nr:uncharacterized protein LOC124075008 [Scatophagus argus]
MIRTNLLLFVFGSSVFSYTPVIQPGTTHTCRRTAGIPHPQQQQLPDYKWPQQVHRAQVWFVWHMRTTTQSVQTHRCVPRQRYARHVCLALTQVFLPVPRGVDWKVGKYWNEAKKTPTGNVSHLRAVPRWVGNGEEGVGQEEAHLSGSLKRVSAASLHQAERSWLAMALCEGLSHCKLALAFAVLMDLLGGAALLVGVFAPLEVGGQDFGDLLVYTGALLVLMSLAGWVLWYSGNIDGLTPKKELGHISSAVDRLARNLSRKIRTYRSHR